MASLVVIYGLYRLRRMMALIEHGDFFSVAATRHLRAFALSLVVSAALDVLLPPLVLVGLRLTGAADVRALVLQVDGTDVWTVLVGTLFFLITSIMAEARRLADDNAQIV